MKSGSSSGPAGTLSTVPSATPSATTAIVCANPEGSIGGNQIVSGKAAPDMSTERCATTAAVTATKMTRTYCMNATSRASAPNASAISTIAVAPPGEAPQTPAVPGRICQRLIR